MFPAKENLSLRSDNELKEDKFKKFESCLSK